MNLGSVKWAGLGLVLAMIFCLPAAAQIQMPRPGSSGPPPKKAAAPTQRTTTLTADEEKRLSEIIKHMKPKDRKRLSQALQKMTPQQKQQLLAAVKKQLAKPEPKAAKRGW
jgi:hypothetical protein